MGFDCSALHMKISYRCNECMVFTGTMGEVTDHLREVHGGEPEIQTVDVKFPPDN